MASIAVIGTGYVGLTTGAVLAHFGHHVTCADLDSAKVARLNRGELPIVEPDLDTLVHDGLASCRLRFVDSATKAVEEVEFVFLAVQTPQGDDGSADLRFVETAAAQISPVLRPGTVVINKSTVPVGATELVAGALGRYDIPVVSNPEFLREGSAVADSLHPDRVVVGAENRAVAQRVADLFAITRAPQMLTDPRSAETIKYASNAYLAARITFVNAVASLCDAVGANVIEVTRGMGMDSRIGSRTLAPGPGFGGSCFPKDTNALLHIAAEGGYDFRLLREVIAVNNQQFDLVTEKVRVAVGGDLERRRVAVWGLTYKANTDDRRSSPAIEVVDRLRTEGASVRAYDPTVNSSDQASDLNGVEVVNDPYSVCRNAHVLVVLTEWPEFAEVDLRKAARLMAHATMVDSRNLFTPAEAAAAGFVYRGHGRQ